MRYVGIDISKTRVHEHLQIHGGPDLLCDSHFPPFNGRTLDPVYSAAVTEHLACPYLLAQEVARVLKPGGYYLGNAASLARRQLISHVPFGRFRAVVPD